MPTPKVNDGDGPNGWAEYRRLVLAEIERVSHAAEKAATLVQNLQVTLTQAIADSKDDLLNRMSEVATRIDHASSLKIQASEKKTEDEIKALREEVTRQGNDLSALQAKATLFGAIAGFIVAVGSVLANMFIKK